MPYAVTHILVPITLTAIFRDFFLSKEKKKKFPLHYVLLAGLGGALPDIDILFSFILNLLGFTNWDIHRTFTHSISFAAIFFLLFLILLPVRKEARICHLTRHHLKLSLIFLMIGIGIMTHLLLDASFGELSYFFYPFSTIPYGTNILSPLAEEIRRDFMLMLDGILLVIWIVYLELKHKISDFI
ncbi:MAG: metal-dependent hydrolase [archaeon]